MTRTDRNDIWFAVVNVYAASSKAADQWAKAEELLKQKGVVFHGTRTGSAGNATELTFDACMAGYRKFIAVGGDGTVHDVLNGLASFVEWKTASGAEVSFSDFTLGVIPSGSGNDWIKTLGIPADPAAAVRIISEGKTGRQDVVKVSMLNPDPGKEDQAIAVSYMANVGGIGIDARICERVNAMKREGKRGKILYVTSLIHAIRNRKPSRTKVVCDGETVYEGTYLSIAFGVGKYSGGGMRQTPAAVLDDGLLDMTLIPDLPLLRIAREAPRLFTDTFLKVPELVATKGKVYEIIPESASYAEPVEVDGEVVGKAPARMEVMETGINIVIP